MTLTQKSSRLAAAAMLFLCTTRAPAQVDLLARLGLLKQLTEALGAAGDALVKITDGIKHLVAIGVEGYDAAAARLRYGELRDLSATLTTLITGPKAVAIQTLDQYAHHPSPADWPTVTTNLSAVLKGVKAILTGVRTDKSDFVLEPAYATLSASLNAKQSLLTRLTAMPAPTTPAEFAELKLATAKYKRLAKQLAEARDALNEYLKQHKTS